MSKTKKEKPAVKKIIKAKIKVEAHAKKPAVKTQEVVKHKPVTKAVKPKAVAKKTKEKIQPQGSGLASSSQSRPVWLRRIQPDNLHILKWKFGVMAF